MRPVNAVLMPSKPLRCCLRAGCKGIVCDDVCSKCGPIKRGWHRTTKGSRQSRGYDNSWLKVRAAFVQNAFIEAISKGVYPMCQLCNKPIVSERNVHVDHINGFKGLYDPQRLNVANLRMVHARCHMQRTAKAANERNTTHAR